MRVYLAGPYGARAQLRTFAAILSSAGFPVTSSWLAETHEINAGTQGAATALDDATVAGHALADLKDIDGSDALVLVTSAFVNVEGGGGRHVETGYAIAKGLPLFLLGEPENVFHRMPGVTAVPTLAELTWELQALSEKRAS